MAGLLDGPKGGQKATDNWIREVVRYLRTLFPTPAGADDSILQRKDGSWVTRTLAQFVDDIKLLILPFVYPVGCLYLSTTGVDPATELGFGTWTAYAAGRALVGLDSGQVEFDTLGLTGGTKTETLTPAQMPIHDHNRAQRNNAAAFGAAAQSATPSATGSIVQTPTGSAGGDGSHNNLPPYIVISVWLRTA